MIRIMKYFTNVVFLCASAFLSICLLLPIGGLAQNIEWEQNYGGTGLDVPYSVQQTADGGYIMAGYSTSSDKDVSGNYGDMDYWVAKLDAFGAIQWAQNYGGSGKDIAFSIEQTADGGYIVVGDCRSSDNDVSGNYGGSDYWVVKLDSSGSIQWEQNYGGSGNDVAQSIQQTADGGYVVAGFSFSSDNDVSGNHGNRDYWVVKLDSTGNIAWEQNYGGSGADYCTSIQETMNGGYIVAGYSVSNDNDVSDNNGAEDYWVVRLDSSGTIEWEQNYGGSDDEEARAIKQTLDGGYVVTGLSFSGDGDVSGNYGDDDFWIVKLDPNGAIEWEQNYGGSKADMALTVDLTAEGGYIIGGFSASNDHDVSANYGSGDYWVIVLDTSGIIQWAHNYGGSSLEFINSVSQTVDGGFVLAGPTNSNDNDVSGNYGGGWDYWLVKLDNPVGIQYDPPALALDLYPNPSHGPVTIDLGATAQSGEMVVQNTLGQTVLKKQFQDCRSIYANIETTSGLYLIQVRTANHDTVSLKVFKY